MKCHWLTSVLADRLSCFTLSLQSLHTDAYDHYSAIYSLLSDRLKKHKTLRMAPPTPRPIVYPLNSVQVTFAPQIYRL